MMPDCDEAETIRSIGVGCSAPAHEEGALAFHAMGGGEGAIQARVIGRRLSSTVVWKPA